MRNDYLMPQERIRSENYPECEPSADVRFLYRWAMIQFHIGSTRDCKVVLKLKRFFHLSGRSFGLDSLIGFGTYHMA